MKLPPLVPLSLIRGDTVTINATMMRDGAPYSPSAESIVICTAKLNPDVDADVDALFQKLNGYGLTFDGPDVAIELFPQDTQAAYCDRTKYFVDIQVQEPSGAILTVWRAQLTFTADSTRERRTSVPIYTANPPLPVGGGAGAPTFTFTQLVPSTTWTIDHGLNSVVSTAVFDVYGNEVIADVSNPTLNQTRITFSVPTAGKARIS